MALVDHILYHINAEANGPSDPSQRSGVAVRAQKVRDALAFITAPDPSRRQFVDAMRNEVGLDAEVKTLVDAIDIDDEGENLMEVFTEWVGADTRPR